MNVYLTGFSATGKSTLGPRVAERLGWRFVDLDAEVERRTGRTIPDLFNAGEPVFRAAETAALADLAAEQALVVATGGGAVIDAGNRALMRRSGLIICLEARPETILARLQAQQAAAPGVIRPLLATGDDPLARITYLKQTRQPFYADADWTVHTDRLDPAAAVAEIVRAIALLDSPAPVAPLPIQQPPAIRQETEAPYSAWHGATAVVHAPGGTYPIFIGHGILAQLGHRLRNAGLSGPAYVISDTTVAERYGGTVLAALAAAEIAAELYAVPPGEPSKSFETANRLFDWLVRQRAERKNPIIALGGGVVGDLAGFVAATYLRGVPFVQVPTTLLAMVDSAIGGKVAVNHPAGKNLLGAFYQPRLVLGDTACLASLTPRERAAGWAEIIKHALILDAEQFADLEYEAPRIGDLATPEGARLIGRSAAIKARVVSEDERETGLRMLLNYGHTTGHALEAATGYTRFLHGEAIAIGMEVAARIAVRLGLLDEASAARQRALLTRLGLPVQCTGVDVEAVWAAIALDKKIEARRVRWILLEAIGRATVRDDVPVAVARAAFDEVIRP